VNEKCVLPLSLIPSGRLRLDESEEAASKEFRHLDLGVLLVVRTIWSDGITEVPAGRGQEEFDAGFPIVEVGPGNAGPMKVTAVI
jgi:hypothetical protein